MGVRVDNHRRWRRQTLIGHARHRRAEAEHEVSPIHDSPILPHGTERGNLSGGGLHAAALVVGFRSLRSSRLEVALREDL